MTRRKKRQLKIDQQYGAERRALKRQKACGSKIQYDSDLEALAWGRESNERRSENKLWNTYFCPYCHYWHLTRNKVNDGSDENDKDFNEGNETNDNKDNNENKETGVVDRGYNEKTF